MLWLSGIQSWPVGQAVKTTPSHGVNPGSIPGQVISYPSSEQKSMKIAEGDFHGFLLVAVNVWTVTPNLLKEWGKIQIHWLFNRIEILFGRQKGKIKDSLNLRNLKKRIYVCNIFRKQDLSSWFCLHTGDTSLLFHAIAVFGAWLIQPCIYLQNLLKFNAAILHPKNRLLLTRPRIGIWSTWYFLRRRSAPSSCAMVCSFSTRSNSW